MKARVPQGLRALPLFGEVRENSLTAGSNLTIFRGWCPLDTALKAIEARTQELGGGTAVDE